MLTDRWRLTVSDTSLYTPPILGLISGLGLGAGWHVTEQASVLIYSGPNQGTNIPAANLAIVSVDTPTVISGQPVDPANEPMVPAISPAGPLDNARMVLHANSGHGAGTYTSTITTTIGSGP